MRLEFTDFNIAQPATLSLFFLFSALIPMYLNGLGYVARKLLFKPRKCPGGLQSYELSIYPLLPIAIVVC